MRVTSLLEGLRARRPLAFFEESHLRLTNVTRQLLQGWPLPAGEKKHSLTDSEVKKKQQPPPQFTLLVLRIHATHTWTECPSSVFRPATQLRVQVTFGIFNLERNRLLDWRGQSLYRQTAQWVEAHHLPIRAPREDFSSNNRNLEGGKPMQDWLLLELSLAGDFPRRMGMPQLTE